MVPRNGIGGGGGGTYALLGGKDGGGRGAAGAEEGALKREGGGGGAEVAAGGGGGGAALRLLFGAGGAGGFLGAVAYEMPRQSSIYSLERSVEKNHLFNTTLLLYIVLDELFIVLYLLGAGKNALCQLILLQPGHTSTYLIPRIPS